jgi:hypothetical protein
MLDGWAHTIPPFPVEIDAEYDGDDIEIVSVMDDDHNEISDLLTTDERRAIESYFERNYNEIVESHLLAKADR